MIQIQPAIEIVRTIGDRLRSHYDALEPIADPGAMMAAFQKLDGGSADLLRQMLAARFPDFGWLDGELDGADAWRNAGAGRFWVCDAIDGAVQFLRKIPHWCVSLTLVDGGAAVATIIYDAIHDEIFHAVAGNGARCNGEMIHVNNRQSHQGGILATSVPPFSNADDFVVNGASASLKIALRGAGAIRNLGPTSLQLAYVASGRLDALWQYGEDGFNCLGGALMVTEAGGLATDLSGQPYRTLSDSIIAGPAPVYHTLLAAFAGIPP